MADTFLDIIKEIRDSLPAIRETSGLFNADLIARLESLTKLDLADISNDLRKGSYLGNRKIDINLALNMTGVDDELIRTNPDVAESIWTDISKTVLYDKATVTFVDGVEIIIPFVFDGNATTVSTHGDLLIQLNQNAPFLTKLENTLISGFSTAVSGEMIRMYDIIGSNSNIEKIILNAVSGEYKEKNPVYFWLKTTSAFQTIAMRSGEIINLTNELPKLKSLANSIDEVLEIQSRIPQLIDTFDANGNPNNDNTIYNNLSKLTAIYSNLIALISVYNDIKVGGTNYINVVGNTGYKTKVETLANSIYKEKIEAVYSNLSVIQNAQGYAQTATQKAGEAAQSATLASDKLSKIQNISVQAQTLAAGQNAQVVYDATTNKFTFSVPQGIKGDRGENFTVNTIGLYSQRALYDNQLGGFSFLALDVVVDGSTIPHIYFKKSNTSGDWTTGIPFGRGEKGDIGETGVGITSLVKTSGDSSSGSTDIYTMTLTNGNTYNISVYNGLDSDITSADLTALETTLNNNILLKISIADIVDNLLSTDTTKPLSANQGRILKGLIDNLSTVLMSDDTTLDELQEIVNFIKQNKTTLDTLSISNIAGLVDALASKVSVDNIKTVNGVSLVGPGDIDVGTVKDFQEFTTSGTWTKPEGCNYVYVEAWGAGQAGGTGINGTGGFFSNALLTASDVSTSVTVTIGAGGTSSAEHGGNSKFGNLVCGFGSGAASSNVSSNNVMNGGTGGGIKYFRDGTSETPTSQLSPSKMLLGGWLGDGTGYGNTYYTLINPQYLHIDTRNSFIYGGYMYTPVFGGWYLIKTEIDNINIVLDTIYLGIQGIGYMGYNYKVINSDLFIFRSYSSAANTGANLSYYKADLSTISSGSITLETKLFTNTHSGYVPQTASIELYNGWYYIVCANMKDITSVPHYVIFKTQDFTNYTLVKVSTSTTNTGVILGDIGSNTNGIYFTYTLNATTLGTNTVFQCVTSDATATTWTNLSTSIAGNRPSKFIVRDNGEIVFACLYYSSGWKMRFCIINSSLTTVTNIQYGSPVSYPTDYLSITKLDNGEIHACTINGNTATIGTSIFKLLISNTIATYFFHTSTFDFQFPIYGNTTSIKGIFRTMSSTNPYLATYKVQTITDSGSAYNEPLNIGFDYTAIPRSKKIAPFFTGGGDGGIAAGGGSGSDTTSSYYVKFQDNPANIAKGGDGLVRVWCW